MMASNWREAWVTLVRLSTICGSLVWRRAMPVSPRIAFIGVRSSWLILARNAVLARLAASASSLARDRASVRCCTTASRWSR